jgi:hypothetical protein
VSIAPSTTTRPRPAALSAGTTRRMTVDRDHDCVEGQLSGAWSPDVWDALYSKEIRSCDALWNAAGEAFADDVSVAVTQYFGGSAGASGACGGVFRISMSSECKTAANARVYLVSRLLEWQGILVGWGRCGDGGSAWTGQRTRLGPQAGNAGVG